MAHRTPPPPLTIAAPESLRVGIARSTFHYAITQQLLNEATRFLNEHHISYDIITAAGSFELAYVLQTMAKSNKYQALVALGCLIKGNTIHFDVVTHATAQGIMDIINTYHIPIGFGVITANTTEQATERIWMGYDATRAAVECYLNTQQYHQ